MSLTDLNPGSLYVLLFVRTDPPEKDNYHLALYLHKNANEGGAKHHITGSRNFKWSADHGAVSNILKSFHVVGLFQVADVPEGLGGYFHETIHAYDNKLNQMPDITCRVWLLMLLAVLSEERDGEDVLKCRELGVLEREIMDWGNVDALGAARNEQPRPVTASSICGL